jgi:hypothetical protein
MPSVRGASWSRPTRTLSRSVFSDRSGGGAHRVAPVCPSYDKFFLKNAMVRGHASAIDAALVPMC